MAPSSGWLRGRPQQGHTAAATGHGRAARAASVLRMERTPEQSVDESAREGRAAGARFLIFGNGRADRFAILPGHRPLVDGLFVW